jgi:hypothetical protein
MGARRPNQASLQIDLRQPGGGFWPATPVETGVRFVVMALGSADEMQVWALYCRDLGYVDVDTAERWQGEYREIARMLTALHRSSSDI